MLCRNIQETDIFKYLILFIGFYTDTQKSDQHTTACDFGMNSTCSWKQDASPGDDFDWTVATSETVTSPFTGPKVDHTSGSRYMNAI